MLSLLNGSSPAGPVGLMDNAASRGPGFDSSAISPLKRRNTIQICTVDFKKRKIQKPAYIPTRYTARFTGKYVL